MRPADIRAVLNSVVDRTLSVEQAVERLKALPFEDLGFARVDHHRSLRTGVPEVVLGAHKTEAEIAAIVEALVGQGETAIVTRVDPNKGEAALARLMPLTRAKASYEALPQLLVVGDAMPEVGRGTIAVVTAGTSDRWVAEEAARVAELLGNRVQRIFDVGVAGLQRLLAVRATIDAAEVVIAIAGMEGALPSVLKGLISRPVIAVPTSVGLGVGLGGFAALLGMLNSCAPGITVVNIDNGFGAGYAASLFNRRRDSEPREASP